MHIKTIIAILLYGCLQPGSIHAQTEPIRIKITDQHSNAIFGVYVINKTHNHLITTTDIDGECLIDPSRSAANDSVQFQGIGYETVIFQIRALKQISEIKLKQLKYELSEATVKGIPFDQILQTATNKLKKQAKNLIPLCHYYATAQYEKITEYRDTTAEYRREFGYHFTSGDTKPRNSWDQNHRSDFIPAYIARSYNMTAGAKDTLSPLYLTYEDVRFDMGTRKIFTLMRAIQLFGPLFNGIANYEIHPVDSEDQDYMFTFKTKTTSYPNKTRISCKGTFTISREEYELRNITFNYIDYQLFRQAIMSDQRKIGSPFSTKATLTVAYAPDQQYYIQSCLQETIWKHNLSEQYLLIEQPSRPQPADNNLIEREAFYCYDYQSIPKELKTPSIQAKIHLAQRYPQGDYDPKLFKSLPLLLDNKKAVTDLSQYMELDKQFAKHDGKSYYPDNQITDYQSDRQTNKLYHRSLQETRQQLFTLFGRPQEPVIAKDSL